MGKLTGILVLALAALLCTGCLDYTENMVIKDDGSGTLSMHIAMDKTYLEAMEQMAKEMAVALGTDTSEMESPIAGLSREKIDEALTDGSKGVRLISIDSSETDESRIWDLKFEFDDINQAYAAMAALQDEEDDAMNGDEAMAEDDTEEAEAEEVPLTFVQQADGTWLFERQLNEQDEMGAGFDDEYESETELEEVAPVDSDDEADDEAEMNEEEDDSEADADMESDDFSEAMADMMAGLGDHKISFTVTFPGDIVESNATSVNGRTATWEFKLAESMNFNSLHAVIRK